VLLGYLAFRGIQNDQALLEKERLSTHRGISELIIKSIDEKLLDVDQSFIDAIANQRQPNDSELVGSIDSLKKEHPVVEELFLLETTGGIQLPVAKLLFGPDESLPTSSLDTPTSFLRTGQQYEFQQNSYSDALASYQQGFDQASTPQVKGRLLIAIARVQEKLTLLREARKSYQAIAEDYSQTRMASGIPLGVAAGLELGSLSLATDEALSAIQTLMGLYQDLIEGKWALEESQYDFFASHVKKSIDELFSQDGLYSSPQPFKETFERLAEEEEKRRKITRRLLAFQANAAGNLQAQARRRVGNLDNGVKRVMLEIEGGTYLVSLLHPQIESQVDGVWGLLLNSEQLKTELLQPLIKRHTDSENVAWTVRGTDGQALLTSENPNGSITIKTSFVGNLPPWSLELAQPSSPLLETFLTSRQSVYFYIFLLLAGILVFGLTLTIRTVTHELELARMKSDFVSTVSHEFKSPVTSIRQVAEMLKAERVPSGERRQRYYDVLVEQSQRLSLLIENILDLSKMDEGSKQVKFEKLDLAPLLHEVVETFQHRVRDNGFILQEKIDGPLPVNVDRTAITQAMTNLIDNAIKYSGESKTIEVQAFVQDQDLIVAVQDFGIGINKEELDKVFERFYRGGDELTRTVKGSGLGLTLVKQVAEAHQGTVDVQSEPGRGSTFSIRLPIQLREDS